MIPPAVRIIADLHETGPAVDYERRAWPDCNYDEFDEIPQATFSPGFWRSVRIVILPALLFWIPVILFLVWSIG